MMLLCSTVAFAAAGDASNSVASTGLTVTVKSEYSGRTYTAYQIFSGDISTNADPDTAADVYANGNTRKLSNIDWASGVDSAAIITALNASTGPDLHLANDATAADVAKALEGIDSAKAIQVAKIFNLYKGNSTAHASEAVTGAGASYTYNITGLVAGYYIVVDTTNISSSTDEAHSAILLNVVGNTSITEKVTKPSVDKEVQDEFADKDANSTDTNGYGETADHAINESFTFKLTATLPADADYDAYDTYKVQFNDTFTSGITFESIASVVVTSDGKNYTVSPTGYTLTDGTDTPDAEDAANNINDAHTFGLIINDLKVLTADVGSGKIDLTKGAVVTVIYNAHLNTDAYVTPVSGTDTTNRNTVTLTYSNDPTTNGTGTTSPKDTYVFTFEVDNTKWAGPGAEVDDPTSVTIEGTETLNSTSKTEWVDETHNKFYKMIDSTWYVMDALAGAGFTLYSDAAKNTAIKLIDNSDGTYTVADQNASTGFVTEMTSANTTGKFNIKGLDAGTYYLAETTTPAGYNTAADVTILITAEHQVDTSGATPAPSVVLTSSSNVDNEIIDNQGTVLPSTGGVGTTIFYIAGSLMVLAAAILLITKRRMGSND